MARWRDSLSQGVRLTEGSLPDNGTFEGELTASQEGESLEDWRAGLQRTVGEGHAWEALST